ncbi:hypothetical protein TNCV_2618491 [Trichonephila clavipes]|nr:hypothetical protein TNCV_2618491 [Trichonephila clavipes]
MELRNDQSQHPDTITNTRYIRYTLLSFHHLIITLPFTSAADPISEKPMISTTTDSFLRPNAPTFYPHQRTQNNNTVFQPHQT